MEDTPKTLRFLQENRAFLRGQIDLLRVRPESHDGDAVALDPRWLRYGALLAEIESARTDGTVDPGTDWRSRLEALLALEAELDSLDAALDAQAARIAELERDYASRPFTSLALLLRGEPMPEMVALHFGSMNGPTTRVVFGDTDLESLRRGGVVEAWHELVEPRAQTFTVAMENGEGQVGLPLYLTLEPAVEEQNLLELDLATSSAQLSTWVERP